MYGSGNVGVGGMFGSGGLGVGGESRIAECRKVVRFVDDGRGILDHDDEIHINIDHSADRVKLALCENPRFDGSGPSSSTAIDNIDDDHTTTTIN